MANYKLVEEDWLEESTKIISEDVLSSTEFQTTTIARKGQSFFRRTVLSSYNQKCCICGLDLKQLLVASHIIPWSVREKTRLDPHNGLSLCVLHDKLFDKGLLTLEDTFKVRISPQVEKSNSTVVRHMIFAYQGKIISLPTRFMPDHKYLQWHYQNVFIG
jgi:predicted restriction endonuclease